VIPIELEPSSVIDEFPNVIERCVFCNRGTRYWYLKKNKPVCPVCSKTHRVADIVSSRKRITP